MSGLQTLAFRASGSSGFMLSGSRRSWRVPVGEALVVAGWSWKNLSYRRSRSSRFLAHQRWSGRRLHDGIGDGNRETRSSENSGFTMETERRGSSGTLHEGGITTPGTTREPSRRRERGHSSRRGRKWRHGERLSENRTRTRSGTEACTRASGTATREHTHNHTATERSRGWLHRACCIQAEETTAKRDGASLEEGGDAAGRREHARVRPAGGGTRAWPRMRENGGVRPRGWSWWRGRDAARLGASRRSQGNGGRRGGGGDGRRPEELAAAGSNEEPGRRRPWRQEVEMELEHGGRSTAAARAKRGSGRRERGRCGGRGR